VNQPTHDPTFPPPHPPESPAPAGHDPAFTRPAGEPDPGTHQTAQQQALLVRALFPGILLVYLRKNGLQVCVEGYAPHGWLRVFTTDPDLLRSIATEARVELLEICHE
jgi:hypothetical protein